MAHLSLLLPSSPAGELSSKERTILRRCRSEQYVLATHARKLLTATSSPLFPQLLLHQTNWYDFQINELNVN